jgi:transcription-repair coupling factor (superfamily II helicase)
MEEFFERLAASGYERASQVTTRGQFAVRGGIVDLYSWQAPLPFRLEFFGDQIESLREFDIDTQTSVRDLRSIDILLNQVAADQSGNVRDYVRERDLIIDVEPDGISNAQVQISEGRKISAAHFRIAGLESLAPAIWCSLRQNARSSLIA